MDSVTLRSEFEGQLKDAEAKIAQAEEQLTKLKEYKIKLVGGLETLDLLSKEETKEEWFHHGSNPIKSITGERNGLWCHL